MNIIIVSLPKFQLTPAYLLTLHFFSSAIIISHQLVFFLLKPLQRKLFIFEIKTVSEQITCTRAEKSKRNYYMENKATRVI